MPPESLTPHIVRQSTGMLYVQSLRGAAVARRMASSIITTVRLMARGCLKSVVLVLQTVKLKDGSQGVKDTHKTQALRDQ